MFGGSLGTISTAADWLDAFEIVDSETDEDIDLTGATATLTVKSSDDCQVLQGSTATGEITFPALGIVQWSFPASSLGNLCPGSYGVGVLIVKDGQTLELFLGSVAVVKGF